MKKISFIIVLLGFLLFRPYFYQQTALLYSGDDESYMAHATALAYFQFPDYSKEHYREGDQIPSHAIGPGIMASPFVFIFSLIDRIVGNPIVNHRATFKFTSESLLAFENQGIAEKIRFLQDQEFYSRTEFIAAIQQKIGDEDTAKYKELFLRGLRSYGRENIIKSWSVLGFILASMTYLWITCLMTYKTIQLFYSEKVAFLTVLLLILVQGVPLYIFRRPIFSHVYELFLQSFLLFLYAYNHERKIDWCNKARGAFLVGITTGMIVLARQYNILGAIFWIILFYVINPDDWKIHWKKIRFDHIFIVGAGFFLMMLFFKIWPALYNQTSAENVEYTRDSIKPLITMHPLEFYVERFINIFAGVEFGLFFTAPFGLAGTIGLFILKDQWRKICFFLFLSLVANFFVITQWNGHGSWYGYRYFIFAWLPIVMLPLAEVINLVMKKKLIKYAFFSLAILPLASMLLFEGSPHNLTLFPMDGVWRNPTYQLEVWKTILFSPITACVTIFKGGALYLIYLVSTLFGLQHRLPSIVLEKYPVFDSMILIKTIILWLYPLFCLWVYQMISKRYQIKK
ncbi:MAG: hypothetical protein HQM12_19610 [SAR324 cluster bacterium]|nr:hypothetical protein [SAR324 cluster bacterium]